MYETMGSIITLEEFIIADKRKSLVYSDGLQQVMNGIAKASKTISWEVNRAGLGNILGSAESENIQGETQQKLDVFADEQFIEAMKNCGEVCGIASEENDDFVAFDSSYSRNGDYVVAFDPLDGSSNIDVNVSIGTIFSIFKRKSAKGNPASIEDFLRKGTEQIAAGYVLYGSSTMLVFTAGNGVNAFTLDPAIGEFCLSHANMKTPEDGKIVSMNEGNLCFASQGLKDYLNYCKEDDKASKRPFSARYIGSMVADFHRNLIKGGIFLYPATSKSPNGKLRLLYECNPLAFIIEQAGGMATTGEKRIMELELTELHQRVPVVIGSSKMVKKASSFFE